MANGISYLNPKKPDIDAAQGSSLDYGFDWTEWLADISDGISTQDVTASTGVTVSNVASADGIVSLQVAVADDAPVGQGWVTCEVVTTGPPVRTDSRTLWLNITKR